MSTVERRLFRSNLPPRKSHNGRGSWWCRILLAIRHRSSHPPSPFRHGTPIYCYRSQPATCRHRSIQRHYRQLGVPKHPPPRRHHQRHRHNEVLTTTPNAATVLVSALQCIHSALISANSQIKVATSHSSSIILDSFPPSQAFFNRTWEPVMISLLEFLRSTDSYHAGIDGSWSILGF